jgi:hypothetical protein
LFTAFINPYSEDNPFLKFSSTTQFGVCWIPRDLEKDPERKYLFHVASDMNPSFPALGPATFANYTNEFILAGAFGLTMSPGSW